MPRAKMEKIVRLGARAELPDGFDVVRLVSGEYMAVEWETDIEKPVWESIPTPSRYEARQFALARIEDLSYTEGDGGLLS